MDTHCLSYGDDRARALGVKVDRMRALTLVAVSFMAATAVSMAGTIGFIGLVGTCCANVGRGGTTVFPHGLHVGGFFVVGGSLGGIQGDPAWGDLAGRHHYGHCWCSGFRSHYRWSKEEKVGALTGNSAVKVRGVGFPME